MFLAGEAAFHKAQPVDKKKPVQVVHLMLKNARQEPFGLHFHDPAFQRHRAEPHALKTPDRFIKFRNAEAALEFLDPALLLRDPWIKKHKLPASDMVGAGDKNPLRDA